MQTKISKNTAMAVVIANMIGTGVFTSLGFQLEYLQNTWSILILWGLGGVMALCGAFSYAELGTSMQQSGGEYHFLSKMYNRYIGYLSGWVSLTLGFAAPIALAAMAAGVYLQQFTTVNSRVIACLLIGMIGLVHLFDLKKSSRFQLVTTAFKLVLITVFIIIGLWEDTSINALDWSAHWTAEIVLPSFAVSFVYVSYAYSGWNAAAYIVDEIKEVRKNLPRALIGGTMVVSSLYVLLQVVFLKQAPISALRGTLEVGELVAYRVFGSNGGRLMSAAIALMLISSISAMVWVGPRVTRAMAKDFAVWSVFEKNNKKGVPLRAVVLQIAMAVLMVVTGSFEAILTYSAFVLQLFMSLTVFSVFLLRRSQERTVYQSPMYPVPQLLFLGMSLWVLGYLCYEQGMQVLIGIALLIVGSLTYIINEYLEQKRNQNG